MSIDISRALGIGGWMRRSELEWLAHHARSCDVIVEVGNWKGRSLRALGDHVRGVVYGVDGYRDPREDTDQVCAELAQRGPAAIDEECRRNLRDLIDAGTVVLIRAEAREGAQRVAARIGGAYADLVFIDADHTEAGCRRDIEAYLPLVRPGGILAGHDYGERAHPGVKAAADAWFGDQVQRGPGSIWFVRVPGEERVEAAK
jgi:hypothetical protein